MLIAGSCKDNEVHAIRTDCSGRQVIVMRGADDPVRKYVALGGILETTVWTPTVGYKFVITDILVSCTANSIITFRDGTAGATIAIFAMLANTTIKMNFQTPIMSTTTNNNFTAQTTAATVAISVFGYEEP
jgi:hypothetical protein